MVGLLFQRRLGVGHRSVEVTLPLLHRGAQRERARIVGVRRQYGLGLREGILGLTARHQQTALLDPRLAIVRVKLHRTGVGTKGRSPILLALLDLADHEPGPRVLRIDLQDVLELQLGLDQVALVVEGAALVQIDLRAVLLATSGKEHRE